MLKNSYIGRLYLILSVGLILVALLLGFAIASYSQAIVGGEIIQLNSANLKQTADNTGWTIYDAVALCNAIAYDSQLLDQLQAYHRGDIDYQLLDGRIDEKIVEHMWLRFNHRSFLNVFVLPHSADRYTVLPDGTPLEEVMDNPQIIGALGRAEEPVLIGTSARPDSTGIYRYTFQVVRQMRDLLSDELVGYVIIDINEKVLHDSYQDNSSTSHRKSYVIVDAGGQVLSAKDKRLIGTTFLQLDPYLEEQGQQGYVRHQDELYYFYQRIEGTDWYLMERANVSVLNASIGRMVRFIVAVTAISTAVLLLFVMLSARQIARPVYAIKSSMEQVAEGNLTVRAEETGEDEFGQIAKAFNHMVGRIQDLVGTVRESERKKRLAELDFLRAQINPHFIYNTLSSIRFYVEMDKNQEAQDMLFQFSKLLRKTLSRSDEFVTLDEELETIRNYVKLQQLRYTDSFQVDYEIAPDVGGCEVPVFLLQPIVENAIYYSVAELPFSEIQVKAAIRDGNLEIVVSDQGIGMSAEQVDNALNKELNINKVGLKNVHERIQLNYGAQYGIAIDSEAGVGTDVIIRLPIRRGGKPDQ